MTQSPVLALRERAARRLSGMLRWDRSGRALLVCDMPRRAGEWAALDAAVRLPARAEVFGGLLYIDLPPEAYGELLSADFAARGEWRGEWFEAQALLAGILSRRLSVAENADEALLRKALLSCAQGERPVRDFCALLRGADAVALRTGGAASCRASAALVARWLWAERGVGLPGVAVVRIDRRLP